MTNTLTKFALIAALGSGAAYAQSTQIPNGTARSSYVSVMSKAGTPTPRPNVPVRYVRPPVGAEAGYNYYYGYSTGYRYSGGGSASPSYANQPSPPRTTTLPGYDTRPGDSYENQPEFYETRRR